MKLILSIILIATSWVVQSQVVKSTEVKLSFFSEAPIEDIKAESNGGVSAMNLTSKSIYFKVPIISFVFPKSLMREHFNENYLESGKYPNAEFAGTIKEPVDLSKDGNYHVVVQGDLNIHGVSKNYTVPGQLIIDHGIIKASSTFPVRLEDHKIKIPRLVIKNIAEVVQVSVSATYK